MLANSYCNLSQFLISGYGYEKVNFLIETKFFGCHWLCWTFISFDLAFNSLDSMEFNFTKTIHINFLWKSKEQVDLPRIQIRQKMKGIHLALDSWVFGHFSFAIFLRKVECCPVCSRYSLDSCGLIWYSCLPWDLCCQHSITEYHPWHQGLSVASSQNF